MDKFSLSVLLFSFTFLGYGQSKKNLIPYVKPIIGTQRMGYTYPGATVPFGMVQLSPDTDTIPLNRKLLNRLYLTHSEIMKGGKLVYYMSAKHAG